ncbi:MAG: sugar phosphate isomerase/epimerase [Pirellulales bacterium]|nr:sugar phosphate isomerase/epimerase [Pirellulales bacterium]
MFFGYNTNGFADHDLFDAVEILAELGYRGVAITIDRGVLSPLEERHGEQIGRLGEMLELYEMQSVIETGARYLLDPWRKHEPTLISAVPDLRIKFYRYAIECARLLGSDCVSIWSGAIRDGITEAQAFERLAARLPGILDFAAEKNVPLAFEPEPGMLIDSTAAFERLAERVAHPNLRLTLDIGHLQCQGETPIAAVIRRFAPRLANVHLDDMRRGVHEHLMFGEGEIEFPPVLHALAECGYTNGVYVELGRHSREAPEAARRAMEFFGKLGLRSWDLGLRS